MGQRTMDLNWEHKLKLMSVCEEASQQVKYQERRGVGEGEGRGEEKGSHMLRLCCKVN